MALLWHVACCSSSALLFTLWAFDTQASQAQTQAVSGGTQSALSAGETPASPAPQQVRDASVPNITPPRALQALAVDYPEGGEGDHTVVLELTISPEGTVGSATVVQGDEPFASSATRSAVAWLFLPAQRDGVPAAARIRVQVIFAAPEPTPTEPQAGADLSAAGAQAAAPQAAAPEQAVEIFVQGERPADVKRLGRAEVRQMPGAFGDAFRAIEALPGVTPIASGLPYFFVRGAPPGNVGYFFDQISMPLLYHAAAGPGVIHPAFIDSVNLYAGAYPAKFGRYAGGIVEGTLAEPQYRWRGEASLRLLDAGAFVEVPFSAGRGSAMLAGRYSYTGLIASLVAPTIDLGYWDYQSRVQYALSPRTTLSLFAFGSHDFFQAEQNGETVNLLDLTFHRLNAKVRRTVDANTSLDVDIIGGYSRSGSGNSKGREDLIDVHNKSLGARIAFSRSIDRTLTWRAGADASFTRAFIDIRRGNDQPDASSPEVAEPVTPPDVAGEPQVVPEDPDDSDVPTPATYADRRLPPLGPFGSPRRIINRGNDEEIALAPYYSRNDWVSGVWLEAVWQAASRVTLTPGIRVDVYKTGKYWSFGLDPRLTARFDVAPRVSLIHTLGVAHQPPSFALPLPGLDPVSDKGLQQAIQTSAGAEVALPAKLTASIVAFQSVTRNSSDMLSTATYANAAPESYSIVERTTAHAYGVEFYLRRALTERLGGFLSYTLSRSTRSTAYASGLSSFDRTHMLNFALAYDIALGWRLGARLVTYSGIPASVAYVAALGSPPRTDWYYRVDWRVEKRWMLSDAGAWIAVVAELLNTTLNEEMISKSCTAFRCTSQRIGPVTLPSLGVEASF